MPLFGNKFSPRKAPPRKGDESVVDSGKLDELFGEFRRIKLNLGDQELLFDNGQWISNHGKNGSSVQETNRKLKRKNRELQEENNLLRIKYQYLLNMLTDAAAKKQLQETDMEKIKKMIEQ